MKLSSKLVLLLMTLFGAVLVMLLSQVTVTSEVNASNHIPLHHLLVTTAIPTTSIHQVQTSVNTTFLAR